MLSKEQAIEKAIGERKYRLERMEYAKSVFNADDILIERVTLEALREKADRESPQPLTLEELKKRDGKPVCLVIGDVNCLEPLTMWALVEVDTETDGIWLTNSLGGRNYYGDKPDDGIAAYDHEPKEAR